MANVLLFRHYNGKNSTTFRYIFALIDDLYGEIGNISAIIAAFHYFLKTRRRNFHFPAPPPHNILLILTYYDLNYEPIT